jgi:hypothetical protein
MTGQTVAVTSGTGGMNAVVEDSGGRVGIQGDGWRRPAGGLPQLPQPAH